MTLRRVLASRFFIVPAAIAAVTIGWNIYVSLHAHGLLSGRVIDAAGRPLANATVVLYTHDFVTQAEKERTKTDASGAFAFTDNDSHLIQLQALDGDRMSARVTIRLWFRAQDRELAAPLVIGAAG
ncbi:MAG TPA: carboxypeptidase-like regulatory domain-containing protein [Stellaceae bacterium]|jgi:hypothetical protein|nr:carboxypeptidase-like regulatory domain-containing protein [Stellaceae bacterium]